MAGIVDRHRNLAYLFWLWVRRDIRSRYAGSAAGLAWAILAPLGTLGVFYVVFALVLRVRVPQLAGDSGFFFFLLTGLLPWLAVADGLTRATGALVAQEQFLQKLMFPVGVLPAAVVVASLVPQLVGTLVLLALLAGTGLLPVTALLWFPGVFALQLLLTLGVGLALSIITVHVRDVAQAVPVLLQLLFYTTPILYPLSLIPETYRDLYMLNPLACLVQTYHAVFLGFPLAPLTLAMLGIWSLVLGIGGWWLFRVLKPTLGDYL